MSLIWFDNSKWTKPSQIGLWENLELVEGYENESLFSKSRIQNFHNCLNESERVLFGLKKTANEQKSICLRKYMFFKFEIRETMQWSAPLFRKWFLTFKILQNIFSAKLECVWTRKINTYIVGKNQGKRNAIGILVF